MMLAMVCTGFVSCSKDDDDDPVPLPTPEEDIFEVAGTIWSENSSFSSGYSTGTYLQFGATTAKLQLSETVGQQTLITTYNFTFRRSKSLVVLTPQENDIATLEGHIDDSGIKMSLYNMSNNALVVTLYKQ